MARKAPVLARTLAEQTLAAAEGLRKLTKDELRHLGLSPTSRAYTRQKAGIKLASLKREKVVSRRQVRQLLLGGKKLEKYAKERRAAGGGRNHTDRYYRYVRQWAADHGITVQQARRDKEFRKLYRTATSKPKPGTGKKRIKALYDLGILDYEDYEQMRDEYGES